MNQVPVRNPENLITADKRSLAKRGTGAGNIWPRKWSEPAGFG